MIKEKYLVGPGYYENIVNAKAFTQKSSAKFSFGKSKSPSSIYLAAYYTKDFPGVGKYSDGYNTGSIGHVKKREKKINPGKTKRYIDDVIKLASTVPGPGTYEIGPPKQEKKIKDE